MTDQPPGERTRQTLFRPGDEKPECPYNCGNTKCADFKEGGTRVNLEDHVFIWMYGGSSSGKTTLTYEICNKYGYLPVHAGELLKREIERGSQKARCLKDAMERGELVPNDMVIDLLRKEIISKALETKGFVIDAYPREVDQIPLFETSIGTCDAFIYLDAERSVLMERETARAKAKLTRWQLAMQKGNFKIGIRPMQIFYDNHKKILLQHSNKMIPVNTKNRPLDKIFADIVRIIDRALIKKRVEKRERELRARKSTKSIKSLAKVID